VKQIFISNLPQEDMDIILALPPGVFVPSDGWDIPWKTDDLLADGSLQQAHPGGVQL